MSWNSLFSFANPNGEIGKQFSASNASLNNVDVELSTIQTLATFTSLPVGIYSVQASFPVLNTAATTVVNFWRVGAGLDTATQASAVALGASSITGFATTVVSIAGGATQATMVVNFILNNSSGASTILINSVSDLLAVGALEFGTTFSTTASFVATKLA